MVINEKLIDKVITEAIFASINDVIKDNKKDINNSSPAKYISLNKTPKKNKVEKMAERQAKFWKNNKDREREYMEKKVIEASSPNGLRFPKGAHMLILSRGKKLNYSIPVSEFICYLKIYHPEKQISKKLIPIKKIRGQMDDEIFYDLIININ